MSFPLDNGGYSVIIQDVQEIINSLKILTKHANKIIKLMNAYEKARVEPVSNAYVLEKKIAEIDKAVTALPDIEQVKALHTWLHKQKEEIEKLKEDLRFKFGQELTALFAKEGKTLRGQYPVLRVGLYTLRVDFEFGEANLFFGPEIEKIKSKIPLQTQIIYQEIKKCDHDIKDGPFEPEKIYDDILTAYRRCLSITDKSFGDKVLITEVLKEYVFLKQPKKLMIDATKKNFREYSRIELSYMLYRLKNTNVIEHGMRFHVATFDATTDKLQSLWIPDNEEGDGTHYEYLSFEKKPH
jgi:hypothetical protein